MDRQIDNPDLGVLAHSSHKRGELLKTHYHPRGGGGGGGVTFYISVYGDVRALKVYFSALPLYDKVCFSASNYMNSPFFILLIISSPEPLGSQSELIEYPSSRLPSVRPSYVVRRRPPF